jgi:hypothetical protein
LGGRIRGRGGWRRRWRRERRGGVEEKGLVCDERENEAKGEDEEETEGEGGERRE